MDSVETQDPNPFLTALKQYKSSKTVPSSSVPTSGSVNPFGDLVKKKIPGGNDLSNGLPSSKNGSNNSQNSPQLTDADLIHSTPRVDMSSGLQQSQPPSSGMIPVNLQKPASTPIQQFTQTNGAVRKDKSWENLGDFVPDTVLGGLQKDAGQLLKFAFVDGSKMHDIGSKLEGYGNENQTKAQQLGLPDTATGSVVSTATNFAPDLLELALTPELDIAKLGKLTGVLGKATNLIAGKFPLLMGAKGLTSGYSEAKDVGQSDYEATKSALIKSGEEYGKGLLFEGAGAVAGKVSDLGKKLLEDKGWMAGNKIVSGAQKALLNSSAQATAFSAVPFVTNAIEGKPTSLDEMKNNAIFGGVLGLFHGDTQEGDHTAADAASVQVLQRAPLIDLNNFANADIDAIKQVQQMPETAADLKVKAALSAQKAFEAETPEEKQQAIVQSSVEGKAAGVKAVTDAVLKDKQAVIDAIPDGPDKQYLTDKVNEVHKALDPTEQEKTALGQKIQNIDATIEQVQPIMDNSTDPVEKTEAEVGIENLQKQKEDFIKQLKNIVVKQHADTIEGLQKGGEDAIPIETAGKMGVRNETALGEEMGSGNAEPTGSPTESTVDQVEKDVKEVKNDSTSQPTEGAAGEQTSPEVQSEKIEAPVAVKENAEKEINSPIKSINNENNDEKNDAQKESGSQKISEGSQTDGEKLAEKGDVTENQPDERKADSSKKIKIDKYELIQPSKLKGTPHELMLGQHSNGTWGIIDKSTGIDISTPKESKWEAINAYEKNREKLTPKMLQDAKAKLEIPDETPKKPLAKLSDKSIKEVNSSLEPHGITYDQIKDYEQSRSKPDTGLPASNSEKLGGVQENVRQANEQSGRENENIKSEAIREQPEKSAGELKTDELRKKVDQAHAEFSKAVKETRKKGYSTPLDPELIAKGVKLIKAYADLGIHKFSEIAKDFINSIGKDNFTDDDADALKSAYAAHVANLEPKERTKYNTLKELDDFMDSDMKTLRGLEPAASIPKYTPTGETRLPVPKEQEEKEAPQLKAKYNKISALKSYTIRNLEQLKAFSKDIKDFDAYHEVRKFATSKSQASVILKTATKAITDLVGKDGWQKLREALVESRLRGIRQRWDSYAKQAADYSDEQVKSVFDDGESGNMYDLVKNLAPLEGETNPAKFATSLIASGRYADAKKYLSDVFTKAADNVLSLGIPFDEMVKDGKFTDPKMQQALDTYKKFIEQPIAESHESNEGIFSDALGDLKTYYPLTGENTNKSVRTLAKGKPYNDPGNINNRFATGQSDNYGTEVADLADKLSSAIKTNNKATALDALKKVGLVMDVAHNAPETEKMQVGNDIYDFVKEKVSEGRTIIDNGNIVNTKSKYVMMPKWLKTELDPIFDSSSEYDTFNPVGKVMNVLTKIALGGPTEAIAHSYRMLGVITNSVPFMQEWAYRDGILNKTGGYVANNPFVKKWTGLNKILQTDISSDKALQTIQEMSKLGIIPEKTWTKTWSREFAELTGAKAMRIKAGKIDIPNVFDFSPILYGKHSIDLKARVMMYNLVKSMDPEATSEQHVKMQNELGVYTKALQSSVERKIKESGVAPYYTFGSSVYRTALKTVTGTSPLPIDYKSNPAKFANYKAAQLLTNGIIGTAASWMLVYHTQTGKWPWEDEASKLGRIPYPEWAKGELAEKFFTDANGDYKDINMLAINNPIAERGLRVTGAEKAYETHQLGGTVGQSAEAGATQALNTVMSPFTSSPGVQAATTLTTGSAPYITALRDDKGKPAPQFFKKVKAAEFGMQPLANSYATIKEANPLIDAGLTQLNKHVFPYEKSIFGLNSITNSDANNEGASALGYILNMAFPRFFVPHGNDDAKSHFIQKAQGDLDKTIEKQQDAE